MRATQKCLIQSGRNLVDSQWSLHAKRLSPPPGLCSPHLQWPRRFRTMNRPSQAAFNSASMQRRGILFYSYRANCGGLCAWNSPSRGRMRADGRESQGSQGRHREFTKPRPRCGYGNPIKRESSAVFSLQTKKPLSTVRELADARRMRQAASTLPQEGSANSEAIAVA